MLAIFKPSAADHPREKVRGPDVKRPSENDEKSRNL